MRVIITGGTGLIGKALAAELAGDYEVIVLSRHPDRHHGKLASGVKVVAWDANTPDGWGELVDGAFGIINLAGAGIADKRWTKERKRLIMDSRINAGGAVYAAVKQAAVKPKVVVQASAVGYYGASDGSKLNERSKAGNDFPAEVTKVWEPSTAKVTQYGVRHVVARIGVVLSMDGGALPKIIAPIKMMAGGKIGSGEQWLSWIHLEDQVRVLRFLLERDSAENIYNSTAPAPVTNLTLTKMIGVILQQPTLFPAPAFALKLALGEMATLVLDGQRVLPERLLKDGFTFRFSDPETALRDLLL